MPPSVLREIRRRTPRYYTNRLLEMIDEGILDARDIVDMCVKYLSEDEVKDMMLLNNLIEDEDSDD